MKTLSFFIILCALSSASAFGVELEKSVYKDVTYDGIKEKIVYRVWGESWERVDWSFSIYDGDNLIYQAKSDEEYWLMTVDRGDWQDCPVKAECMEKMYGPGLIEKSFQDVGVDEERYDFMLEMFKTDGVVRYQRQFGISIDEAKDYANRLYEFLSGKDIIGLAIPRYQEDGLLTYDKFLKNFVIYYSP